MKTKIILSIMLGLSALAFIFTTKEINLIQPSPPAPGNNDFIVGAMGCGDDWNGYSRLNDLNINLWHTYTGVDTSAGWANIFNDDVWVEPDDYRESVNTRVEQNYVNNLLTFFDRPKFVYLAYGQSSMYQAEPVAIDYDRLWFYGYETHQAGTPESDNGATVMHCSSIELSGNSAGWVCKDLRANREQCYGAWYADSLFPWYIMPRIRIPATAPAIYPNKKVCRIDILDWDSTVVDSVTIYAKYFAPWLDPGSYSGGYVDQYYYHLSDTIASPRILGGNTFLAPNKYVTYNWDTACGIDYRIWWFDEIECWIDYVKVENQKAHDLLSTDPNNIFHVRDSVWVMKEVQNAMRHPGYVHNCYIEEFEYSILPCVKKLNEWIKHWSDNNLSLTVNVNDATLRPSIPHLNHDRNISAQFIYNNITSYVGGYKEFVNTNYPLFGFYGVVGSRSVIPNTLPACQSNGCTFNVYNGILADSKSPAEYDEWLQEYFDNDHGPVWDYGEFTRNLVIGSEAARLSNMPFVPMLQTHLWYDTTGADTMRYSQREPTNEELKVMGNLAVSYGAKGILWFWYSTSWGNLAPNNNFGRGLTEVPATWRNPNYFPRHDNVYNQWTGTSGPDKSSKFNTVKELNTLWKDKWGPTLMSFNDNYTQSYIYRLQTERNNCLANTYFADVVSYFPNDNPQPCQVDYPGVPSPPGLKYDCKNARYLQVATFKKTMVDGNKYFMIVNRRCSPFINENSVDNNGGRRLIKARFSNHNHDFDTYNRWNIYEIKGTEQYVGSYTVTNNELVQMGDWFSPGEGRLFVMRPA